MSTQSEDLKIERIDINSFRGSPGHTIIDFRSKNSKGRMTPASMVIFGDCGTGKSTIADAIELSMSGSVRRYRGGNIGFPPMLSSGCSSQNFKIITHLSNQKIIEVTGSNWQEDKYKATITWSSKIDRHVPFVLRRCDILAFSERKGDQKFLLFKSYVDVDFIDAISPSRDDQLNYDRLEKEKTSMLYKREQLCIMLANDLGVDQKEIPYDHFLFMNYCTESKILGKGRNKDSATIGIARRIIDIDAKVSRIKKEQKVIIKPYNHIQNNIIISKIKEMMVKVSGAIRRYFLEIQQPKSVEDIELVIGEGKDTTIEYRVNLNEKISCRPEEILSEGNYDLLGLLTFLAMLKSSEFINQPKVLVLDDVMQSINSLYRIKVAELICKEFKDWQIIITTNDRIWFESVSEVFRRSGINFSSKRIISWSKEKGSIISDSSSDLIDILNQRLEEGSIYEVSSLTGLALESLCHTMSWSIPISIERKKNDRYTLGDLWPGIEKALKKSEAKAEIENVSRWLLLRNMIGAHYNEWARELSDNEIREFAQSVITLHDRIMCSQCHQVITSNNAKDFMICRCGKTKLSKK